MNDSQKKAWAELKDRLSVDVLHVDIPINQIQIECAKQFVQEVVKEKVKETNHKFDNKSMETREFTGKIGEIAVEYWLMNLSPDMCKGPFVDYTVGKSKDYNIPDLLAAGYNLGCKTVTYKNFAPLVPKNPDIPELICLWDEQKSVVHILGIATPNMIKEHGDIDLVISEDVKKRGTKTGFGKFSALLAPTEARMKWYQTKS